MVGRCSWSGNGDTLHASNTLQASTTMCLWHVAGTACGRSVGSLQYLTYSNVLGIGHLITPSRCGGIV